MSCLSLFHTLLSTFVGYIFISSRWSCTWYYPRAIKHLLYPPFVQPWHVQPFKPRPCTESPVDRRCQLKKWRGRSIVSLPPRWQLIGASNRLRPIHFLREDVLLIATTLMKSGAFKRCRLQHACILLHRFSHFGYTIHVWGCTQLEYRYKVMLWILTVWTN